MVLFHHDPLLLESCLLLLRVKLARNRVKVVRGPIFVRGCLLGNLLVDARLDLVVLAVAVGNDIAIRVATSPPNLCLLPRLSLRRRWTRRGVPIVVLGEVDVADDIVVCARLLLALLLRRLEINRRRRVMRRDPWQRRMVIDHVVPLHAVQLPSLASIKLPHARRALLAPGVRLAIVIAERLQDRVELAFLARDDVARDVVHRLLLRLAPS
mmetsp:Transcript_24419/g.68995  ORF Transcript_24419/g.68995 Transcript_24419/m.68995 type:complete len:211 (-) Transcript_24419:123-755(-)